MCFVWIWEQTAIISLYNINWLVRITETECVYCAVRTGSLYIIQVMCFVWIWEQTAIISLYSINWLVCITETENVYCEVRTGSLYIVQVNSRVQSVNCFSKRFRWLVDDDDDDDKFRGRRPAAAARTLYNFSSDKNRKYLGKKVDLITKQTELLHFNKKKCNYCSACGRLVFTFVQILNQILCNISDKNKRYKGKGLEIEEFHCSCWKRIVFMQLQSLHWSSALEKYKTFRVSNYRERGARWELCTKLRLRYRP